ncbi:MAG: YkgJ family cysteine cluster protein [Alphaproteobacteria bacterium]|nr:YkgJ family cysteine cluster protein [Alphaproteobacteria bacterium]
MRIPLSVDEALDWSARGNRVQILVEAWPLPDTGSSEDANSVHDMNRSFAGNSGTVRLRIFTTLVARHEGACPHLRADKRCGIYHDRPRICRIYPRECRPLAEMNPALKACPPEAWTSEEVPEILPMQSDTQQARAIAVAHRQASYANVPVLVRACARLEIVSAGFAGEGFAVYEPPAGQLADALCETGSSSRHDPVQHWSLLTNQRSTHDLLKSAGCSTRLVKQGADYIGTVADDCNFVTERTETL